MPDLSAVRAIYQLSLLKHHRREGRILLKNSSLIEGRRADSIPTMGGSIGDDGTAARGATGAVLRVLA